MTDAVSRAEGLASGFERCYVLLVRPNTDALRNFQARVLADCVIVFVGGGCGDAVLLRLLQLLVLNKRFASAFCCC